MGGLMYNIFMAVCAVSFGLGCLHLVAPDRVAPTLLEGYDSYSSREKELAGILLGFVGIQLLRVSGYVCTAAQAGPSSGSIKTMGCVCATMCLFCVYLLTKSQNEIKLVTNGLLMLLGWEAVIAVACFTSSPNDKKKN
eukprot:m.335848 g.335848  ORF g.335848 m.335848 type:complete len:138 (+) comp17691_c0_seq1:72-485(+)